MSAALQFDEATHTYTVDGRQVPSVTTVLKDAGLVDYTYCTDYARERGSAVHKAIHFALEGDLDDTSVLPIIRPYVDAALIALSELKAETIEVERRVFSSIYGYAGTLDWIGTVDGNLTLIDWKTMLRPVPATALQLAAYAHAYYEETRRAVIRRYACSVSQHGTYQLHPYTDRHDINAFRSALVIANWKKEKGVA